MKESTSTYADHLLALPWLESVGGPLRVADVRVVESWDAAIAHSESRERDDMLIDMANAVAGGAIDALGIDWYCRNWNRIAEDIRSAIREPIRAELDRITQAKGLSHRIVDDISWCTIHACFEVELSDCIKIAFFREHVKWYEKGRFPCAWEGEYPQGQLVVF